MGDALGLSAVHVNRVLQELRGAKLITLKGGVLSILDWDGLRQAGEFDPVYLHLDTKERGAGGEGLIEFPSNLAGSPPTRGPL